MMTQVWALALFLGNCFFGLAPHVRGGHPLPEMRFTPESHPWSVLLRDHALSEHDAENRYPLFGIML
jgi:hypothetical protein